MNIKPASPPFNKPTADAILRTSDLVDFRVRRSILVEASSIFEDMFRLPQSRPAGGDDEWQDDADWKDGIPVVVVTEDSTTLDRLLRLCYPVANPVFATLDEVRPVLEAARKYMMEEVVPIMRSYLSADRYGHPLRVFAIACRNNLEAEAWAAAQHCILEEPLHALYVSELEEISAGAYFRLLQYNKKQGMTGGFPPRFCDPPHRPPRTEEDTARMQTSAPRQALLASYPYLLASPDVTLRTSDDVEFHVHSLILGAISPVFRHIFRVVGLEQPGHEDEEDYGCPDVPRVFQVSEDSHTMARLLQYCYPTEDPALETVSTVRTLLLAARKYEIAAAVNTLRKRLMKFAELSPLRVFAIACAHHWVSEAKDAARLALRNPIQGQYVDELEGVSAGSYFRLLRYHEDCGEEASKCVRSSPVDGCLSVDFDWTSYSCSEKYCNGCDGQLYSIRGGDGRSSCNLRPWLGNYLQSAALALSATPCGAVVVDDKLFGQALAKATACAGCRPHAYTLLRKFATILAAEAECAISSVAIDLS